MIGNYPWQEWAALAVLVMVPILFIVTEIMAGKQRWRDMEERREILREIQEKWRDN